MPISYRRPSRREAARMAPLSVLPVFFDLSGRRAVVAGGSAAAAWKAELLAAAGAEVHVHARNEALSASFRRLLARGASAGAFVYHDAVWTSEAFEGAALAVADADSDAEAAAFLAAADAAGVPANLIDRPDHCRFQFGTIVNRSPAVIGISTSGAAPILGQAIRRRIEAVLPRALAEWSTLASRLRARVGAVLKPGHQRRRFWELFVDAAFSGHPGAADEDRLLAAASTIGQGEDAGQGRVTLVGAGPGDAELLTLKAVRALQSADVILHDDLVSEDVLELARREAERISVGKRGGRRSCRQDDINDLMVRLAGEGRHVVRLKSGDPMIFGRAGEEIARLEATGVPFEIVPGITAALAMAAALGVSLTNRDGAKSVRFVTAHSKAGGLPRDLDWQAIAEPTATTIFYMGRQTAGALADRLMAEGLVPSTPVAVASAVAQRRERTDLCRLGNLAATVALHPRDTPLLIGIGTAFASHVSMATADAPPAGGRATPRDRRVGPV